MKVYVLLPSLLLALSAFAGGNDSAPPDSGQVLDACNKDGGRELCLQLLVALRCHEYAFPLIPLGSECAKQGAALAQALDLKAQVVELEDTDGFKKKFYLTVAFHHRLEALLHDRPTQKFIQDLMVELRRAGRESAEFNLWDNALRLSGNNEDRALERLGVLLQDTSRTRIQIFYLRGLQDKGLLNPEVISAIDGLQVLQELIREDRFSRENRPKWLSLYPRAWNLNETLNPSLYHFYTMAYAARQLRLRGTMPAFAGFLPFLFNATYEFRDLDPEMWPLRHPRPFPLDNGLVWKMKDIYAGLAGGLFGVGRMDRMPEFGKFAQDFSKSPRWTMRRMFYLLLL